MKAIAYLGCLTDDEDRTKLRQAQMDSINDWCRHNGHVLVGVCQDTGLPRNGSPRPGLEGAIREACARAGLLVVRNEAVLAVSPQEFQMLKEKLRNHGASLVSIHPLPFVGTVEECGKIATLPTSEASKEARDESHGENEGRGQAASYRRSGLPPFGYDHHASKKTLVENAIEQKTVALARQLRQTGLSLRAIGQSLQARGHYPRRARKWNQKVVRSLLIERAAL